MNRVIASATRACSVASASSRSRRALRVAIFLARTELRPGGFGEGLVGEIAHKLGVETEVDEELQEIEQDVAPDAVLDVIEETEGRKPN